MSRSPNAEQAAIEESKLVEYALNPGSERGQHRARVLESALGFNLSNSGQLRQAILAALPHHEARCTGETPFGAKHEVVLPTTGPNGRTAHILTVWQFDRLADAALASMPRLVTLYIRQQGARKWRRRSDTILLC